VTSKKSAPAVEVPAKVDPQAALSAHAGQILCGKSGMIAVKATFSALTIVDGEIVEVPMGSVQAPPRDNKVKANGTHTRGFFLNTKIADPTLLGQAHGTRFQVGCNVTAVKSAEW